jgi:AraC-like DNA-binding protein/mannose-6-phosphate isomerase-like protein (cupin superfamily)
MHQNITLNDTLEQCISRARSAYDNSWIITNSEADLSFRKARIPIDIENYFNRVTGLENHLFTEICYCLEGCLAMQLADNIIDVQAGEACLIFPGVAHTELPKKDSYYLAIWITFRLNTISVHVSGKDVGDGLFYTLDGYTIKSNMNFNPIITNIENELANKQQHYMEIVKFETVKLLIMIHREINDPNLGGTSKNQWKEAVVIQVQNYITKNFNRCIKLNDISQELCVSSNYINSVFKLVTGKTIIHYVEEFKVKKAKEMLLSTEYKVSAIANELGYYDQYHFSKIFKKETGLSPTQYRITAISLGKAIS